MSTSIILSRKHLEERYEKSSSLKTREILNMHKKSKIIIVGRLILHDKLRDQDVLGLEIVKLIKSFIKNNPNVRITFFNTNLCCLHENELELHLITSSKCKL